MNRLRDILLTQYIGAITIGMVLAQAVFGFVNAFVQVGATYLALRQARSVMGQVPEFSWHNFITSMVTVFLYAMICLGLIRWLYVEQVSKAGDTPEIAPEGTQEP
jgi:hypothetical protein